MAKLFIPQNYEPLLNLKQTEHAIKTVKDHFQTALSAELRLRRVTAPLFVMKGTGINDDLNGTERPVAFPVKEFNDQQAEVVHSLAKWKRMMLADYEIEQGFGLYTDMNAIRPDEELSNIHSLYVDQWDWERHITPSEYTINYLKYIVKKIYEVMKRTEFIVFERYPHIKPILPEDITFIHAQELLDKYPDLTPKEREDAIAKEYGAVFVIGIGSTLSHGEKHDGRAPDYDDWSTPTSKDQKGLNGDILVWNPILERSFELSSMGIRVSPEVLSKQLEIENCSERKELMFHKRLLNNELPLSIGGGIGQSRLCMFFLRKAHIGEIQSSIWPADMREQCKANKIILV
ncbi:aspartate--ammonia ligase [Carboxylicivirga sp. M1479]|uniref:aspartate--ammonia ligase n=1 Tax=Carboxylicivirga sp. M1479 TaxID=2594476 RepID=UPI001177BC0E|nr:aspartate--ammonia ligase [Carboxylicivirga sp. M1479]TRX62816.1 aspartate--ammonia ligase [Carboxylicivirga sp. M1479]